MTRYPKTIALIAGAVAATGFAPLGLWPLTLVGFAVLMTLVGDAQTGRSAFARGWMFGVGHFAVGLNWIAHAFVFQEAMPHWLGYVAVVALSLYLAVYPAAAGLMAWSVASPRRRPGPVAAGSTSSVATPASAGVTFVCAFAAAWIVTEYARATFFTGFAWNPVGVMSVGTPLAHGATLVGTYGLSGVLVLIAGWGLAVFRRDWSATAALAAIPVALLVVGLVPLTAPAVRELGPLIRVVQPNLSLSQQRDDDADERNVETLERLSGTPATAPRLVLWPEGAVPYYLGEESWARYRIARLLGPRDVLMTGGSTLVYNAKRDLVAARNSVFALNAEGDIVARYDKTHLVPYGEYLPMRPVLSAIGLARLVESDVDFVPGTGSLTTTLPGFGQVGVQICYEIIFSGEVSDPADRPRFIFNPSIDAWFGAWGPPQHLAQARLRAIEEGLPIVRATTTGISAIIDPDGRVLAALPLDKAGFIATRLPPAHAPTVFARYGNLLPMLLALVLAILAVAPRWLRR